MFLRNLTSVFKVAAWVIPGSAKRTAFEESLNPFFKSMQETEAAWNKLSEFTKVSLSFVSPGEVFANSETYEEDKTRHGIQTSEGSLQSQHIVLGTVAFGVCCLFQQREQRPRTLLTAKVILEESLWHVFGNGEEQNPASMSDLYITQRGDGCDP